MVRALPPRPIVYEVNTAIWLTELRARHGAAVTLGSVPSAEWDRLAATGAHAVWLMGVWERSPEGLRIATANQNLWRDFRAALPDVTEADVLASPLLRPALSRRTEIRRRQRTRRRTGRSRRARVVAHPRLRPQSRRARSPVGRRAPGVVHSGHAGRSGTRAGRLLSVRPVRDCVRTRSLFSTVVRRRAGGGVFTRSTGGLRVHPSRSRQAVRRRPLRHGDAADERRSRPNMGIQRGPDAGRRVCPSSSRAFAPRPRTSGSLPKPIGTLNGRCYSRDSTIATTSVSTIGWSTNPPPRWRRI